MRSAILLIAILLAPRASALELSRPPDLVAPGEDVELLVTGATYQQVQLAKIVYYPRDAVRVRGSLSWGLEPRVDFRAQKPGKYLVAVTASIDGVLAYDEVEIVVAVGPEPPPVPPDPPVPPPDTRYQIMLFRESGTAESLSAGQTEILASLKLREELKAKGHVLLAEAGVVDVDEVGPDGKIPEKLKPWFDAIKGESLPRIALAPIGGGPIRDYPLPADKAGLWKLLEGR